MEIGDVALLYRERRFFFAGNAAFKVHNRALALDLWCELEDRSTWEYIFFLTDLEPVDIPIEHATVHWAHQETSLVLCGREKGHKQCNGSVPSRM
jgi:hypothetical protein